MQKVKLNEEHLARLLGARLATEQIKENLPEEIIQEKKLARVHSWKGEKMMVWEESYHNW